MAPRLLVGAALAVVLLAAGCGGDDAGSPTRAPADVERAVRAVFDDYADAMGAGDYARACTHLAPESVANLRDGAERLTDDVPADCAGVLALIQGRADAGERDDLAEVIRTARVDGVYETEPPREGAVVIAWTATVDGERTAIQQPARRIGGDWKLVGAGQR